MKDVVLVVKMFAFIDSARISLKSFLCKSYVKQGLCFFLLCRCFQMLLLQFSFYIKYILHGDKFGGQLVFYKVLFVNDYYVLYKLKCLKVQFSLWNIWNQTLWSTFFIYFIYEGYNFFSHVVHPLKYR